MPTLKQMATALGVAPEAVRDALAGHPEFAVRRGAQGRGNRRIPHTTARQLFSHFGKAFARRTVTLGIEKGGVGKSFLTCNVAATLAPMGCRCLLIDLDPQACATNLLLPEDTDYSAVMTALEVFEAGGPTFAEAARRSRIEGLDLVACKGKARRLHRRLANDDASVLLRSQLGDLSAYDLVLFDVPPTFGDIITSAYLTSDLVVMPTLPDIWSIESIDLTLADIRDACQEFECPMPTCRVLLNRYAQHRAASRDALQELEENYGDLLLPFHIREAAAIQNAINEGYSVYQRRSGCSPEVREAVRALAETVCPVVSLAAAEAAPPPSSPVEYSAAVEE